MKKLISIFILLICLVSALSAQLNTSAGAGGLFDMSLKNGVKNGNDNEGSNTIGFGGYIFYDASYVEVDIYFTFGIISGYENSKKNNDNVSAMALGFSVLGKFPLSIGSLTVFPLLGISYNMVLSAKDSAGNKIDKPMDYSQFGILGGAGVDFDMTSNFYIRGELLFHVRLESKYAKENYNDSWKTTLGMGPLVKVGVGYRL